MRVNAWSERCKVVGRQGASGLTQVSFSVRMLCAPEKSICTSRASSSDLGNNASEPGDTRSPVGLPGGEFPSRESPTVVDSATLWF